MTTRRLRYLIRNCGVLLALALSAASASAQADSWDRLVAEADSIGPETPRVAPGPSIACGPGVETPDSVQVFGSTESDEFLFARRSLRTRGYFSYLEPPSTGSGRFALRNVLCDPDGKRPRTFVLERDHRYFYLVFSLRHDPDYGALTFRSGSGEWQPFRWAPDHRTFSVIPGP
jgi:hypothetical protein